MGTALTLRENLLAAKRRLAEGRAKLKLRHQQGSPGIQVCAALADLLDSIILELYETALDESGLAGAEGLGSQIALVAHGGYGRRDVAPYSDVDLMILVAPGAAKRVDPLATRLFRDLYDLGFDVGHSVRTPRHACRLALQDATICTSLMESRYLAGNTNLLTRFVRMFQKQTRRHRRSLLAAIVKARLDERARYGETVYLLEPNIKRSRGGLREMHLLRWIGSVRYGTTGRDGLQLLGILSPADNRALQRAAEFLLRLRNEMHFHAGQSSDVLDRGEQMRIAKAFAVSGDEAVLPVERFMQEYFRRTNALAGVVSGVAAAAQARPRWIDWFAQLVTHQVEGDFRVGPQQITATRRGLATLDDNLGEVLRLADLANLYDKRIAHSTSEKIRRFIPNLSNELSPVAVRHFLSLMAQPARLGELLRMLHDLGALEKVIPAVGRARCLLQFNKYHKYTVDEHCLLAVEQAANLAKQNTHLGHVYRRISKKQILHLALLLHDLGKGFGEDHSEVGVGIADETAARLNLSSDEADTIKFLVRNHLLMSHLAFRRDTSDDQLVVRFAVQCRTPEVLRMLYVLTASDFAAVGPGVWTDWKAEVLAELYDRAMRHLAGEMAPLDSEALVEKRRAELHALLNDEEDVGWMSRQIEAAPPSYLKTARPGQIIAELRALGRIRPGAVAAHGRYLAESDTVEYQVGTYENIAPGVFHRLTGALTSQGLQVLSAEIYTLADGLVLDRFFVNDPDYAGEPPKDRLRRVEKALRGALTSPDGGRPTFARRWRLGVYGKQATLSPLPTQIHVDNTTSARYTVIDVFAADRPGLLYAISKTLFELGLSVSLAKIATHLDQVVDVFYVTDQDGDKIEDGARIETLRQRLLERIEAIAQDEAATQRT